MKTALLIGNGPSIREYDRADWVGFRAYYDDIWVVNQWYKGAKQLPYNLHPDYHASIDTQTVCADLSAYTEWVGANANTQLVYNNDVFDYLGAAFLQRNRYRIHPVHVDFYSNYGNLWPNKQLSVVRIASPRNVMLFALPMAVYFGATSISLIGCDFRDREYHWYDDTGAKREDWAPRLDAEIRSHWVTALRWCRNQGVKVYNKTLNGAEIEAFDLIYRQGIE